MENSNKKLRWGVLGYAGIARKHVLPAFKQTPNAELYAIASRSNEKLSEAKKAFGFKVCYDSYDKLLDDKNVDAVYIPLPNSLHKEWVIKAADKKKHILCEKPLSLDKSDCLEMAKVAKKNDVFLMEAFMYRFTSRTKLLTQMLDTNTIGDIRAIKSSYRFKMDSFDTDDIRLNKNLNGGALHDVGCYAVNVISMIMKDYPVKIKALKNEYRGVDISLSALLKYQNGTIASLDCGFDSQSCLLTEISGTKGSIIMRDTFLDTDAPIITIEDSTGKLTIHKLENEDRYLDETIAVTNAILEGKKELLSLEETSKNNELIASILKIAEE